MSAPDETKEINVTTTIHQPLKSAIERQQAKRLGRVYIVQSRCGEFEFDNLESAEDKAEELVISGRMAEVELGRWQRRPNLPGLLPETVMNISRLDIFSIIDGRLTRRTCNIF